MRIYGSVERRGCVTEGDCRCGCTGVALSGSSTTSVKPSTWEREHVFMGRGVCGHGTEKNVAGCRCQTGDVAVR